MIELVSGRTLSDLSVLLPSDIRGLLLSVQKWKARIMLLILTGLFDIRLNRIEFLTHYGKWANDPKLSDG